jgi:16S rRNA (cytidine1402-2'-O)-methyltransferase
MSTLYIVATPIGNMEDITLRAIRILGEVDVVLCEDTRTTKNLLTHHGIHTKTMSYNAHATKEKMRDILALLSAGKNIALVSDAGTPAISDPGVMLVKIVHEELPDVMISPIPGASAVISALSVSGLPSSEYIFLGFLPHKKGRETLFREIATTERTVVFYESPHRILKTLASLVEHVPEKVVMIGREITKIYEEFPSGTARKMLEYFTEHPDRVRGEFVVIVSKKI